MPIEFPEVARRKKDNKGYAGYLPGTYQGGGGGWVDTHKHTGDIVVYEAEKKQLFAASSGGLDQGSGKWDLIIDLANNVRPTPTFVRAISADKFKVLNKYVFKGTQVKSEVLQLDWPDGRAPEVTLQFWYELWDLLPAKTVVACMGGHGRTGTCLAALMIASGVNYYDALKDVRKNHCNNAVESVEQEKYLHALYCAHLSVLIKETEDTKLAEKLKEALEYAKANVPSFQTTHAVKGNGYVGHSTGDWETNGYRSKNGQLEHFSCTDPKCKEVSCRKRAHMSWEPWYGE